METEIIEPDLLYRNSFLNTFQSKKDRSNYTNNIRKRS